VATDSDLSPSDVVAVEELLDVGAVNNETLKLDSVHVGGVREDDKLYTDTLYAYNVHYRYYTFSMDKYGRVAFCPGKSR